MASTLKVRFGRQSRRYLEHIFYGSGAPYPTSEEYRDTLLLYQLLVKYYENL
jgi:hypothetical protein